MEYAKVLVLVLVVVCSSQRVRAVAPLHLQSAESRITGRYIVVLKNDVDVNSFTRVLEASVLRTPSEGKIGHKYSRALNGFSARLSKEALTNLLDSEHVEYIEEDGVSHIETVASWGLGRIDQMSLPLNNDTPTFFGDGGKNAHIYVFDTGIRSTHDDFSGRIGNYFDYATNGSGEDCHGHGTHVSGTAAGTTYGVAKEATIHPVRVYGCAGTGPNSNVIAGIDWVIDEDQDQSVASMSLSSSTSTSLNTATNNMFSAGIVVSVAAGNQGVDASTRSPASATNAITVGATDSTDDRWESSNYGASVNIFAPGKTIKSDYIKDQYDNPCDTCYAYWSGTSMACPHVSGALAIMRGMDKDLTADQLRSQLYDGSSSGKVGDLKGSADRFLYIGTDTCMPSCSTLKQEPERAEPTSPPNRPDGQPEAYGEE